MVNNIRGLLIPKEKSIEAIPINAEKLLENINNVKEIVVKTNFASDHSYPFSTSINLLKSILNILTKTDKKVTILDSGNKNISINDRFEKLTTELKLFNVDLINAEEDEQIFIQEKELNHFAGFWLPKKWIEADFRINLANIVIHRHHFDVRYMGVMHNLIGLLSRTYYGGEYESNKNIRAKVINSNIDSNLLDLWILMNKHTPFFNIVDLGYYGLINEHSFFLRAIKSNIYIQGFNTLQYEKDICDRLELPFYPEYLAEILEK